MTRATPLLWMLTWALVSACGPTRPRTNEGYLVSVVAPRVDTLNTFVPLSDSATGSTTDSGGAPTTTPNDLRRLLLTVRDDVWVVDVQDQAGNTTPLATWSYRVDDSEGMYVDGTQLLPARMRDGAQVEDGVVTSVESRPVEVRVRIGSGPFAGEWAFRPESGPAELSLDGQLWAHTTQEELR